MLPSIAIRYNFTARLLLLGVCGVGIALLSLVCDMEVVASSSAPTASFSYLSPEELKEMIDREEVFNLVDIRSFQEYMAGHLPNAVSIPYKELPYRYAELDFRTMTVLYCETGLSCILAAQMLARLGFSDLYILAGGFATWEYAVEMGNGRQVI